jgi:uncharacterized membrane protein
MVEAEPRYHGDTEAVALFRQGLRARTRHSVNDVTSPETASCPHRTVAPTWLRVIACDGQHDILECLMCGEQRLVKCGEDLEPTA